MLQLCLLTLLLAGDPALGHWRATLGPADSEVPFDLVLSLKSGALAAEIRNGDEHIAVPEIVWHGSDLVLGFPYYDSRITAKIADDGKTMAGEWKKRSGREKWTTLEFRAQAGDMPRFPSLPRTGKELSIPDTHIMIELEGRSTTGMLEVRTNGVPNIAATVLTDSGDLRFLAGSIESNKIRFSCFDGAFAFAFVGTSSDLPPMYSGTCRMGAATGTWTTRGTELQYVPGANIDSKPPPARFPLAQLSYSDVDGVQHALAEPLFEGKPMLIAIGGSWCPNCHDEMGLLAELEKKYAGKGLSITELCFEYSGDFQRDALQAKRMAERHGANFRVLLGGTAGKGEPAKAFPVLESIDAFPTTLFVRRDGSIAAIHTGFAGPATASYPSIRKDYEALMDALLASPAPSSDATWTALLANPLRDERDGLFLTVKRNGDAGSYEAEEITRWDGPTRQGVVDKGEVHVQGDLMRLGKTLYRWDESTKTFYDPTDFAHRLVNAVRPHLPVLGQQMIQDPDDLATKLVSADPRWRAETRYHLTKAMQSMQVEPRYETWRGIDDEDPYAACAAVWAAGQMHRVELCEGIAKLLEHPFAPLRHEAVRALGSLGYEKSKDAFPRMAQHDLDAAVRAIAADPPKPRPPPGPPGGGEEKH